MVHIFLFADPLPRSNADGLSGEQVLMTRTLSTAASNSGRGFGGVLTESWWAIDDWKNLFFINVIIIIISTAIVGAMFGKAVVLGGCGYGVCSHIDFAVALDVSSTVEERQQP